MLGLIRNAIFSFLIKCSNAFLAFLVTVLAAYWLTPESFGLLSVYQSIFVIVATFALFGMDQELLRRYSMQSVRASDQNLASVQTFLSATFGFFAIIVSSGTVLLAFLVFTGLADAHIVSLGFLFSISFVICRLMRAVALAEGSVISSQFPESVLQPMLAILVIGYFVASDKSGTSVLAYQIIVVSFVVAAASLAAVFGRRAVRLAAPKLKNLSTSTIRLAVIAGLPFLFVALSNTLLSQIDILLLASLSGTVDAGIGRLLIRIADFASFGAMAAAIPVSRWAANINNLGESELRILQRKVLAITLFAFAFSIVYSVAVLVVADIFLAHIDEAYVGYRMELAVILFGRVVFCFFGLPTVFLAMQGYATSVVKCQAIGIILNIVLSIALIPRFGILGAALATSVSILVWKALASRSLEKQVGVRVSVTGLLIKEWGK